MATNYNVYHARITTILPDDTETVENLQFQLHVLFLFIFWIVTATGICIFLYFLKLQAGRNTRITVCEF